MSPLRRNIRQRSRSYERRLGPSTVYLDDIEDIVRTLREVAEEERSAAEQDATQEIRSRFGLKPDQDLREALEHIADEGEPEKVEAAKRTLDRLQKRDLTFGPRYKVNIKAGEAEAQEAEDLRGATSKELGSTEISLLRPNIVIWFRRTGAYVLTFGGDENPKARQLVDDIADFVNDRRVLFRRPGALAAILISISLAALGLLIMEWRGKGFTGSTRNDPLLFVGVVLSALLGIGLEQFLFRRFGSVVVVPERRDERRGFAKVTRRDAIIALVGAAIGAVLGTAGALLVALMTGQ